MQEAAVGSCNNKPRPCSARSCLFGWWALLCPSNLQCMSAVGAAWSWGQLIWPNLYTRKDSWWGGASSAGCCGC